MRFVAQCAFVAAVSWGVVAFARFRTDPVRRTPEQVSRESPNTFERLNAVGALVPGGADTIVVFSNFECVWCGALWRSLDSLRLSGRAPTVRLRHHVSGVDSSALESAAMFECAAERGRSREVATLLFERALDSVSGPVASIQLTAGFTDSVEFAKCVTNPRWRVVAERDSAAAHDARVSGTPALFSRRYRVRGAISALNIHSLLRRSGGEDK